MGVSIFLEVEGENMCMYAGNYFNLINKYTQVGSWAQFPKERLNIWTWADPPVT